MRFRFIEDHRQEHPVRLMCHVLGVSPSGYYAWRGRPESMRATANRALLADIRRLHERHRGRYGSPRIHAALRAEGGTASRGRVERLMRRHGIRGVAPRRFRPVTTDSRHGLPIAPDLLGQGFQAPAPNRVWLSDITYIATEEGWLYLAAVLDLATRKVVGWAMREHLRAELVSAALLMAAQRQRPTRGSSFIPIAAASTPPSRTARCSRAGACGSRWAARAAASTMRRWRASFTRSRSSSFIGNASPAARRPSASCLLTSRAITIASGSTRLSAIARPSMPSGWLPNPVSAETGDDHTQPTLVKRSDRGSNHSDEAGQAPDVRPREDRHATDAHDLHHLVALVRGGWQASSVVLERQGTILSWSPGSRAYADRCSLASLRAPTPIMISPQTRIARERVRLIAGLKARTLDC